MARRPPTRHQRHADAARYVTAALRARHCRVAQHRYKDGHHGVTLDVWRPGAATPQAIAVRAATPRPQRHRVWVGGRRYEYEIVELHWNLHAHGARRCQPDVWVLVRLDDLARPLVLPNAALGPEVRTVQLIADPKRGRSKLRDYAGRWDVIMQPAARAAA